MFRAIPTNNKICFDKDLKRSWRIHQEKLKSIKSNVSKDKPKHYVFLDQRAKKYALEDFRNTQIAKQNNSLLTKIKNISQKGSKSSYLKSKSSCGQRMDKKTLNEPFRKRQLNKIVRQNQQIMKRIQSKKSVFNVRKWQKQRKQIEKNITLISNYPFKNYPSTQTQVNMWMTQQDLIKKSRVTEPDRSRMQPNSLIYSSTQKIGQSYYLIESYLNKKVFNIEIENLEDPTDKYRMQMPQKDAYQLIQKNFRCDLRNLIEALQIDKQEGICYLKCQDDFIKN